MDILFCGDAGVEWGVAMAALSVADHTERPLVFHLMTAHLPDRAPIGADFARRLETALRQTRPDARVRYTKAKARRALDCEREITAAQPSISEVRESTSSVGL